MGFYDFWDMKVGRNSPCPCGSGRKFKKCHAGVYGPRTRNILPDEVTLQIAQAKAKQAAFEAAHGSVKPIISTEFRDSRFVAVGDRLHYAPKEKYKCFPDFLSNYLQGLLGAEWGNAEIGKPLETRHQILKWYHSMIAYQKTLKPDVDGIYRSDASGAMLSWYRLAYDLYLIKHNAVLQRNILERLRHREQFQGARFELCVTASMICAGFDINYENESDGSRKHAEFIANNPSGLQIAVEAKSRHRRGVLDYKSAIKSSDQGEIIKVTVEGILRAAISKEPDLPYFVFVDVNLPASEKHPEEDPWFKEMAETVETLKGEWRPNPFPVNAIFFCNDPNYYAPEDITKGYTFWCYEVPIENARHPLLDKELTMHVADSMRKRVNIPNDFPDS